LNLRDHFYKHLLKQSDEVLVIGALVSREVARVAIEAHLEVCTMRDC